MSSQIEHSAEIQDLNAAWEGEGKSKVRILVKTEGMEAVELFVPAGWDIPSHRSPGEVTLHCLKGRVQVNAMGKKQQLEAGQLIYLPECESHALKGVVDATLLLTIALPGPKTDCSHDPLEEALDESFPASDPPARTPITGA